MEDIEEDIEYLSDTESEGTSTSTASTEPFDDEMPALETASSLSQESPYQQQEGQGRMAGGQGRSSHARSCCWEA